MLSMFIFFYFNSIGTESLTISGLGSKTGCGRGIGSGSGRGRA